MTLSELLQYNYIDLNCFTLSKNNSDNDENIDLDNKQVRCMKCGRILKDYQSIKLNIGPLCLKQYQLDKTKPINLLQLSCFGQRNE